MTGRKDYNKYLAGLVDIFEILALNATPQNPMSAGEIAMYLDDAGDMNPPDSGTIDRRLRTILEYDIKTFPYNLQCVRRISKGAYSPYQPWYDSLSPKEKRSNNRTRYYYLDPVLTHEECRMLADLIRSSPHISKDRSIELFLHLTHLDRKIAPLLPSSRYASKQERDADQRLAEVIRTLEQAITQRRKVRLKLGEYQLTQKDGKLVPHLTDRAENRFMDLEPYALTWSGGHYYLVGKAEDMVSQRVDHIMQVGFLEKEKRVPVKSFDIPSTFDPEVHRDSSPMMLPGRPGYTLLRCRAEALDALVDTFGTALPHYTTSKADGTFEATLRATPQGVKAFALAHLDTVEVLEPASLRQELLDTLRQGAETYAK